MSGTPSTDAELLDAWRRGDVRAGEELFERHYRSIERFFQNKVPEAADDLIQATFLACVEAQHRFRGDASVRTFLFAVAHNQLRNHFSRGRRRQGMEQAGELDLDTVSAHDLEPGPSTLVARRAEQRLLLEGLRRIPLAYQIVLELHYWEELTADQIADVLGLPVGTAKTRIRRGRQLLEGKVTEIASSREELESTIGGLDGWARSLRARAYGEAGEDDP